MPILCDCADLCKSLQTSQPEDNMGCDGDAFICTDLFLIKKCVLLESLQGKIRMYV